MSYVRSNGIRLAYQRAGQGESVLLVMGSGAASRTWTMYQTPALHQAGYESVIFDNRGVPPSDSPAGRYSLDDMVADTRGLIEALDLAPCRIVGTSMGAVVTQELAINHPDLVHCAVLIATRARTDAARRAHMAADLALIESGVRLPARYSAATRVFQMLSPTTLADDDAVSAWLDVFELADGGTADGQAWVDLAGDQREALKLVTAPCRVVAFADDLITPPFLCAEVADAIPDCDLVEVPGCGHLGHLERPEPVNAAIVEFLDKH